MEELETILSSALATFEVFNWEPYWEGLDCLRLSFRTATLQDFWNHSTTMTWWINSQMTATGKVQARPRIPENFKVRPVTTQRVLP